MTPANQSPSLRVIAAASLSLLLTYVSLASAGPAMLAAVFGGGGIQQGINQTSGVGGISSNPSLITYVAAVAARVLNIIALAAVIGAILAGIYLIISQGEEGEKDKAKKMLLYIAIGLVVILLARVAVGFLISIL